MDLRAHGESEAPEDEAAYSVERILEDVLAVADACQVGRFALWGWSWGGTIGLQLAARSDRLERAVIAGTGFGRIFTEEWAAHGIGQAETARTLREQGRLSEMGLPPDVAEAVARAPLTAHIACLRALVSWPEVQPGDLRCPALVYTGTADPEAEALEARRADMAAAGIGFQIFEALDHTGLLGARDVVLPPVRAFLRDAGS
jgi:pimeloyl-ACP methyl ester carboxylesterase